MTYQTFLRSTVNRRLRVYAKDSWRLEPQIAIGLLTDGGRVPADAARVRGQHGGRVGELAQEAVDRALPVVDGGPLAL